MPVRPYGVNVVPIGHEAAYMISQSDVAGPFNERIQDLEKKSELQGLSYKSPQEELAEKFHMSQDLLRQLNPNAPLRPGRGADCCR